MPMIEGKFMDDARFKTIVDILMGRTSVGIDGRKARRACEKIARRAVSQTMQWDATQEVR